MNTRALLVALLLAGVGAFLLIIYLQRFEAEASGGQKVVVLVARQTIKRGEQISEDMLATRAIPVAYVDDRTIKAHEKSKILRLPVGNRVEANQSLLWTDMAFASDKQRDLSSLITKGRRAVFVRATSGDKSFNLIRPGDYVDLIGNFPQDDSGKKFVAVVLLQRILVLAVGTTTSEPNSAPTKRPTYAMDREMLLSMSVTLEEAQMISLATEKGKFSVALRGPQDGVIATEIPDLNSGALIGEEVRKFTGRAAKRGPTEVKEQ